MSLNMLLQTYARLYHEALVVSPVSVSDCALGAALLTGRAALEDVGMLLELFCRHTPPRAGGS